MYKKLFDSNFAAVDYFNQKLEKGTLQKLAKPVKLRSNLCKKPKVTYRSSIAKVSHTGITFSKFIAINKIHEKYLVALKSNMSADMFLNTLRKLELTGAMIYLRVNGIKKAGIVIEERENSISVVHENDTLKLYLKCNLNFYIFNGGIKYCFLANGLKLNRKLQK